MKSHSKYIFALTMLMSMPSLSALDWSFDTAKRVTILGAITAAATQLYTQHTKSEAELNGQISIIDEESPVDIARRVWTECIVGQIKKQKEVESVDLETGVVNYKKFPARGVAGRLVTCWNEHTSKILGAAFAVQTNRNTLIKRLKALGLGYFTGWIPYLNFTFDTENA